jgi:thioredoxin 2
VSTTVVTCPNCGRRNRIASRSDGVPRCSVCHHHLPWVVDAAPGQFDSELRAAVPVLVDFWAPWCGPCKWVEPVVEEAAKKHAGELKVVRLNVDDEPEIAGRFQVQGIPALAFTRDGEEVDRIVGAVRQPQLDARLEQLLHAPAGGAA